MIPILYEDEDVIAADKPPGLSSIAEAGGGGLPARLKSVFPGKLYSVHRLDKDAGGVILLAKSAAAHRFLNDVFARRAVRKTYLAAVLGTVAPAAGRIDRPLRAFGSGRMGVDAVRGQPSLTDFETVEALPGATLLRVRPLTGRRHQIRVHLYSLGHPIVGDLRYGDRAAQRAFPRLMLHALELALRLPSGNETVIAAPAPESFTVVLEALHRSSPAR